MPESGAEKRLAAVIKGLGDEQLGRLTRKVGEGIRAHLKRRKLTRAGPKYLNVRTDNLRSSFTVVPHSNQRDAVLGTNVEYALPLEYGTKDGRLKARYYFQDSIRDSKPEQAAAINQYTRRLLGGAV